MKKTDRDTTRLVLGLAVGLLSVGGVAVVMMKDHPAMQPPTKGQKGPGVNLTLNGSRDIGATSSIPNANLYDTGPINTAYNPKGWDYMPIGVKV